MIREQKDQIEALLNQANWHAERKKLRSLLLGSGLEEKVKWGKLCYTFEGSNVAIIYGLKNYCAIGFFKGSVLNDDRGILIQPGKHSQAMRQIRFACRCLQGIAAGIMVPAGQAVLADLAGQRQLGRLMGTVGFAVALGPALGPGLGGILIELVTWRGLFWINVPVGIAALIGSRFLVPSGDAAPSLSPDMKGMLLVGIGLPLLLFGSAEIGASGPDVATLTCTVLGAALIGWALRHLRRADAPLIDLRLFARPGFAAAVATASLTGAAMYAGLLLFPLYLQRRLELGETETGGLLLVMGLGSAIALPIAGKLTDRHGAAVVSVTGAALLLLSTVPFIAMPDLTIVLVAALLGLRGIGLALAQMPAITAAFGAVRKAETGDAATIANIAQRIGGAAGATSVVLVIEQGTPTPHETLAFSLLIALAAVPILSACFLGSAKSE